MQPAKSTIFDVAKRAGVSIKTVSRVVNREPNVRDATRQRVELAVTELDYRPDQSARNLASHRSHLIGLVYEDPSAYELPSSGYIINMQQGALRACRAAMRELLIHPCDLRRKDVTTELRSVINDARLSGVVLAAPLSNMERIVRAVKSTNTPFVRLSPGRRLRNQLCVVTNDRDAARQMTEYLASLGHRRIAFISGNADHAAVSNRVLGYEDAMQAAGRRVAKPVIAAGDNSFDSGLACAEQLLNRKRPPTAIFAANDDMAAGVIRMASRMGISVPQELSIAGFDDITLARQMDPTLTTIRQPLASMAEHAVSMLTGNADTYASVPASLKIRESTGPAPK
ncbi:MAG: LacI family DNA-binding transcriptional regulator [Pseudomonadota bacterium]